MRKIQLKIASFFSPDVEVLQKWIPDSLDEVYILVELAISGSNTKGADLFEIVVATPEALRSRADHRLIVADRGLMVVSVFSWEAIKTHLEAIVKKCEADTWNESVLKLQRYFFWEYEDMQPGKKGVRPH